jgi:hypothetical protein
MLLRNYLLKGEPLNEIKYKNWKIQSWIWKEMKLDKVDRKWNWKKLVEALMSTTRLPRDDNARRSDWKVLKWISCPIQKSKPLLNIVNVSRVVHFCKLLKVPCLGKSITYKTIC